MIVAVDIDSLSQADRDHRGDAIANEDDDLCHKTAYSQDEGLWICTRPKNHPERVHLGGFPDRAVGFAWYEDADLTIDEVITDLKLIEANLR